MEQEINSSSAEIDFNNEVKPTRPQFLQVLCILSFIWVGVMVLLTIYGIFRNTPEYMQQQMEQLRQVSPSMADSMEEQLIAQQNDPMVQIQPYLTIVFELISLLGVIQMFNLKRIGFYIYAGAELLPYVLTIMGGKKAMAAMSGMGSTMETAAITMMVLAILIDIAFVIMYALNLKHMK